VDPSKAKLVFDNDVLDENSTPEQMDMEENDCIDFFVDGK